MKLIVFAIAAFVLFATIPASAQTVTKSRWIVTRIKATDRATNKVIYQNELKQHWLLDDEISPCESRAKKDRIMLEKSVPGSIVEITCEGRDQ